MPARINSRDVICNNDGGWWVDLLYNNVTIIGPAADIKAFRKLYIVPPPKVRDQKSTKARFFLNRIMPTPVGLRGYDRYAWRNDHWGSDREPWNVQIGVSPDPWTLSFSFESGGGFPLPIFQRLARQFSRLSFYCFSLDSSEWYMEHGWLNTPDGCYDFHEVDLGDDPEPFTCDGVIRDAVSELRHHVAIAKLKGIARQIDGTLL